MFSRFKKGPNKNSRIAIERVEAAIDAQDKELDLSALQLLELPENLIRVALNAGNYPSLITPTRPLRVVLCQDSVDLRTVKVLYEKLSNEGWMNIWFDIFNIIPGLDWKNEIEKAAEDADAVIICLSTQSLAVPHLRRVFKFFLELALEKPEKSNFIIPIRLDDCEIPYQLRHLQYQDIFPESNNEWAYYRLLESLKLRAYQTSILTPIIKEDSQLLRVFLCHTEKDKTLVREMYNQLTSEGWMDVWLSEFDLLPGQHWRLEIADAISRSEVFIVFLSENSVNKPGYFYKEMDLIKDVIAESLDNTKLLIPLQLDNCKIPSRVYMYRELAYFPLEERKSQYQNLLNTIKRLRLVSVIPKSGKERTLPLISLNLSHNKLTSIPKEISLFGDLRILDLSFNQIETLPREIQLLRNLQELNLDGNPLKIPPEILEKNSGPLNILNYYFSNLRSPLNECKVLCVGQGGVGKTSLIKGITSKIFSSKEPKTEGIAINRWQPDNKSQVNLYLWDFGGQEIMHATHQFFLTKRSLYLLVVDSRLTQEENRVEYWLKIIQSFGGESPVLIVGNKIDQHPLDIDRTGLQKKYPNIVGILETSAATGAGIEELKAAIAEQVNNLPHVRDLLPETWFTVKTKLEELGKQSNFITHDKYLDLCAENEVSDETSQRTLIGFLHDLGVVLHFQDDPRLEALGILNPQWVTNGVYKILNSHTLFQNKGVLTVSMLDEILNLPEYPRGKRLFIVDMMKKFELCWDIEPDKTFLVPDLLPKDQPDLEFNGIPAFEYAYPVLPSSVITRFIVRMNQKIDDGLVWRTGVVLKIGENKALVKADIEDRKITIAIDGLEHKRREAIFAIRYELGEIHNSIKGLNPQQRVPIPDAPEAEPLDYDYLLQLERDGFEEHPVKNGNRLVKVNVRKLLSGVVSEAERKQSAGNTTNIYISGDVKGSNIITGDENELNK